MKKELQIPPEAEDDPEGFEILRMWGAKREQHVTINWDLWDDPSTWGIVLADLANHVANAFQQERGLNRSQTLAAIQELFNKEIGDPTDNPEGKVLRKRPSHRTNSHHK